VTCEATYRRGFDDILYRRVQYPRSRFKGIIASSKHFRIDIELGVEVVGHLEGASEIVVHIGVELCCCNGGGGVIGEDD
jgi:hypothetical protein